MDFSEAIKDERLRTVYEENKSVIDQATSDPVKLIWLAALKGMKPPEILNIMEGDRNKNANTIRLFIPMLEKKVGRLLFERKTTPSFNQKKLKETLDGVAKAMDVVQPSTNENEEDSQLNTTVPEAKLQPDVDKVREVTDQFLSLTGQDKKKISVQAQQILIEREKNREMMNKMAQGGGGGFTMDQSFFDGIIKMMQTQMQMQMAKEMMGGLMGGQNTTKEDPKLQMLMERLERMEKKSEFERQLEPIQKDLELMRTQANSNVSPELVHTLKRLEDRINDMRSGGNKADDWKAILELQKMGDTKESRYIERMTEMDKQRQQEQMQLFQNIVSSRLDQINKTIEEEKKKPGADITALKDQLMAVKELSQHVSGEGPGAFEKMAVALGPSIAPIIESIAAKRQDTSQQLSQEEVAMINELRRRQYEEAQHQAQQQAASMNQASVQDLPTVETPQVNVGNPPGKKLNYVVGNP